MLSVQTSVLDQPRPLAMPRLASGGTVTAGQAAKGLRVLIRQRPRAGSARPDWVLEFEPFAEPFVRPLVGWVGARIPLGGEQLDFLTREDAVAFARRHGWSIELVPPSPAERPDAAFAPRPSVGARAHT